MKKKKLSKKISKTQKKVARLNRKLDKLLMKQAKSDQPQLAGLQMTEHTN